MGLRGRMSAAPYAPPVAPTSVPPFEADVIQGVADVLGETVEGLSGAEIDQALAQIRVLNVSPGITKRHRISNALAAHQNKHGNGKSLVAFINRTMAPVRYRNNRPQHARRMAELNEVLIYAGLAVDDEGDVVRLGGGAASTLDEAARRAGSIRSELRRRGTHRREQRPARGGASEPERMPSPGGWPLSLPVSNGPLLGCAARRLGRSAAWSWCRGSGSLAERCRPCRSIGQNPPRRPAICEGRARESRQ